MRLRVTVRDADTDQPLPCRLSFRGEGIPPIWGKDAVGQDMAYQGPPRLWCDGQWSGELGGTPGRVGNIARELPLDTLIAPWAVEAIDLMADRVDDPICWKMWHMLLDQGHRIGLCAFNDACYDRAGNRWSEPVAYRRTYVHIDGEPTWQKLVRAIRAGRTFGTTGPLLLFAIAGEKPGHIFPADGRPRMARLCAWGAPAATMSSCWPNTSSRSSPSSTICRSAPCPPPPRTCCATIPGRAMSANCATPSSGP